MSRGSLGFEGGCAGRRRDSLRPALLDHHLSAILRQLDDVAHLQARDIYSIHTEGKFADQAHASQAIGSSKDGTD
jgi:hypothetical protein